jgi:hypothetical protein
MVMDGRRFDGFARDWGTGIDRRRILRAAVMALLAAVGTLPATRRVAAQGASLPALCAVDDDCRAGNIDPCLGAVCTRGRCQQFIVDCAPGYACCDNGTCCPDTVSEVCTSDADCGPSADPCAGARCEHGLCVIYLVMCAAGFSCCGNGVCCPDAASPPLP